MSRWSSHQIDPFIHSKNAASALLPKYARLNGGSIITIIARQSYYYY